MSNKYFEGVVSNKNVTGDMDEDFIQVMTQTAANVAKKMDHLRVADAITELFQLFKRCNKYIDETMPWALAKDPEQMDHKYCFIQSC